MKATVFSLLVLIAVLVEQAVARPEVVAMPPFGHLKYEYVDMCRNLASLLSDTREQSRGLALDLLWRMEKLGLTPNDMPMSPDAFKQMMRRHLGAEVPIAYNY